jgi:Ca-activated chloride channel family protein
MRGRIALVAAGFLCVANLVAQSGQGEITGVVRDTSGAPLPGVTVEASSTTLVERMRVAITDTRGVYAFRDLAPGEYRLTFTLPGFAAGVARVTLVRGSIQRLDATLKPGPLEETITIAGEFAAVGGVPGGIAGGVAGGVPAGPGVHDHARTGSFNTEAYDRREENPFRRVSTDPLSTFSIDVDTASYANVRRFLATGQLPPAGAVRTEELINYFRFDYPQPAAGKPFSVTTELSACPWNPRHRLALVGLQAREIVEEDAAPRNLVFLIDVSGSMTPPNKLPLLRQAMRMLVDVLNERDRVAVVVYAGASGLVLPSTSGDQKATIGRALADLQAGGSTNGAAGIELAYRVARENFIVGGVNRVVLATDGDFNVGVSSQDGLIRLIERERESGVFLSVLGVGTGNLEDSTMEKLADHGNGNYAYLDSLHEARKVLVRQAGGTLVTVAKDVKIQVEFNPKTVGAYRLIGYENRLLRNEDFNDDRKDAGDLGAGHAVTALYEIVPPGEEGSVPAVDPLKYQRQQRPTSAALDRELMTVKIRYKEPDDLTSRLVSTVVRNRVAAPGNNLGFAAAVAQFGMLLTSSSSGGATSYESAIAMARRFRGADLDGYRAEFLTLAERAASLTRTRAGLTRD